MVPIFCKQELLPSLARNNNLRREVKISTIIQEKVLFDKV